jgi:hypothetical protein
MKRLGMVSCALWLAACSGGWEGAQTKMVDGYALALKTKPEPLQVGQTAELSLKVTRSDQAAQDCTASFRQYMPGMEMASDTIVVTMKDAGGGVYAGTSPDYSMGGDWQIEVKFACDGQERTALFDYTLEWPE